MSINFLAPHHDIPTDIPQKNDKGWFNGDRIIFTGNKETLHGALFHEFKYIEGHKKGKIGMKVYK